MELDDAYDNLGHIPGAMEYIAKWVDSAAAFREQAQFSGQSQLDQSYGPTPRQSYDVFFPERPAVGLCIFVHGGYWRRFDRRVFSHVAAGPIAQGWVTALPSYDLCPNVRISEITRQISAMIHVAAEQFAGPIALAGHSAGGHLVARMLDPGSLAEDVATRLRSVTAISPVSDLRPLLRTSMNEDFRLTQDEAASESPVLMSKRRNVPVRVWVGADERPAFLDQARWLSEAWTCPLRIAGGKHHLDVIDAMIDPESQMIADILGQGVSR